MLVKRALGYDISESEFEEAIGYFIDFYRSHALVNTRFYPGVKETLAELDERRYRMAVLTNKPEKISQDILRELGVSKYFFRVYGGNSFPSKKPDPIGIHTLLKEAAVGHSAAMMIGDTNVDIRTARNARVTACGVTWGFKPESLNDPAPDFLIDPFAALLPLCPHNMALS